MPLFGSREVNQGHGCKGERHFTVLVWHCASSCTWHSWTPALPLPVPYSPLPHPCLFYPVHSPFSVLNSFASVSLPPPPLLPFIFSYFPFVPFILLLLSLPFSSSSFLLFLFFPQTTPPPYIPSLFPSPPHSPPLRQLPESPTAAVGACSPPPVPA